MDSNKVIQDFNTLVSGSLHKEQLNIINGVFKIVTDFNHKCSDFLEKNKSLVRHYEQGQTPFTLSHITDGSYKYEHLIMVKEILKYDLVTQRPVTRIQREKTKLKTKDILKFAAESKYDIDDMTVTEHLEEHMDAREDYLKKYPKIVELLEQGVTIRKINPQVPNSYDIIKKVSIIWRNDPAYLQKYTHVQKLIKEGLKQREVAHMAGVSLEIVGRVTILMGFNFMEQQRIKGVERVEKKKKEKKIQGEIKDFILSNYEIFKKVPCEFDVFQDKFTNYILPLKPKKYTKKQFTHLLNEFIIDRIDYNKRIHAKSKEKEERKQLKKKAKERQERARLYKIKKREEEIENQRLYSIERKELTEDYIEYPTEEKLKVLNDKRIPIPETNKEKAERESEEQRERNERIHKLNVEHLDRLLAVGINPFDEKWDSMPKEFHKMEYRGTSISEYWAEDQKEMKELTETIPDFKEYAYGNLKEINEEKMRMSLIHLDMISSMKMEEEYERPRRILRDRLDTLLAVGINPFDSQWSIAPPVEYTQIIYNGKSIAQYYMEDANKMKEITETLREFKPYAADKLKEKNEDGIKKHITHLAILGKEEGLYCDWVETQQ